MRVILGRLFYTKFLVELVNASAGVDQLLLACIKWVTIRADFHLYVFLRAARLNNLTASALNGRLLIVGMEPFLHHVHLFQPVGFCLRMLRMSCIVYLNTQETY